MARKPSLLTRFRPPPDIVEAAPAQTESRWLEVTVFFVVLVGGYFLWSAVGLIDRYEDKITANYLATDPPLLPQSDFTMFYAGSRFVRASDNEYLYDLPQLVRRILIVRGYDVSRIDASPDPYTEDTRWLRYYNPPFFLFALTPITFLDIKTAYLVMLGLNIALLVLLAISLAAVLRWRQPESILIALALAGFAPVYFTLEHGQPTVLLALLLATGYLALRNGRIVLAAVFLALTSLKPNWLLPALATLKPNPRLRLPFAIALLALLILPFAVLGPDTLFDYVRLITARGNDDLTDPIYAGSLLSWAGFFRALLGEPHPELWLAASIVTMLVFLVLWWRAGTAVAISGSVLAGLIVVPHSHPQDWVLVAPAAAILLQTTRAWHPAERLTVAFSLLALYTGTNDWQAAQHRMEDNGSAIFWSTFVAFALLCYLALISWRQDKAPNDAL